MKKIFQYLFYLILINWIVTQTIDTYSHPDLTKTRVFFRSAQTFIWNFKLN